MNRTDDLQRVYDRCIKLIESIIEDASDLALDEMDVAALQTAIEAMSPSATEGPGGCGVCEDDGVWATDGSGPFDCYGCGRVAK
jgi:hypothetical protein